MVMENLQLQADHALNPSHVGDSTERPCQVTAGGVVPGGDLGARMAVHLGCRVIGNGVCTKSLHLTSYSRFLIHPCLHCNMRMVVAASYDHYEE